MRKIYLLVASALVGATSFGQTTITSHFEGAVANLQAPQVGVYNWQNQAQESIGYISGTNDFGDIGVVQLFDASYGVSGSGVINSVKVMVAAKQQAASPGSITVGVWENDGGNVGNLIASQVVSLNDIDTSIAGASFIGTLPNVKGIFNVEASFSTAPAIPSNNSFFAGILLPATSAAGDTVAVLTTSPAFNFANAATHAGVVDSDGDFFGYAQALPSLTISNAIFPTITLDNPVSVASVLKAQTRLYPNPATDVLNIDFGTNEVSGVSIINLNGQVVLNSTVNNGSVQLNTAGLNSGLYIYQAIDAEGNVLNTDKFSKR